jgi:hypothetical protein
MNALALRAVFGLVVMGHPLPVAASKNVLITQTLDLVILGIRGLFLSIAIGTRRILHLVCLIATNKQALQVVLHCLRMVVNGKERNACL